MPGMGMMGGGMGGQGITIGISPMGMADKEKDPKKPEDPKEKEKQKEQMEMAQTMMLSQMYQMMMQQ